MTIVLPEVGPGIEYISNIAMAIYIILNFCWRCDWNIDGNISISKFDLLCDLMTSWQTHLYTLTQTETNTPVKNDHLAIEGDVYILRQHDGFPYCRVTLLDRCIEKEWFRDCGDCGERTAMTTVKGIDHVLGNTMDTVWLCFCLLW